MKFVHLGDLHIGKRVNDFLMLNDQEYVLEQIIDIISKEKIDGVLIAGDVYDKQVPSLEAIKLFDDFLTRIANMDVKVFIISGNHDSAERLSFAGRLIEKSGVYIAPMYEGNVIKHTVKDEYGDIDIYMLSYVKPVYVKKYYPDREIDSYNDALKCAMESIDIDEKKRNIIVAHQFVTGATVCDSEELSIGGLENVDASIFDKFDYVALGHIHGAQKVQRDTLRYSGTPLKYSFSEINHKKSITIVEIKDKKDNEVDIGIELKELKPLHDMRKIKGEYDEITLKENYINTDTRDYMHIILTDEDDIPDAIGKLRAIYPNIMKLEYDNARTRSNNKLDIVNRIEEKTPLDLFKELYELQNNQEVSDEQEKYLRDIFESIG